MTLGSFLGGFLSPIFGYWKFSICLAVLMFGVSLLNLIFMVDKKEDKKKEKE